MKEIFYYVPSVPIYLSMLLFELWVTNRRGLKAYSFADTISDLSCGLGQQSLSVVTTAVAFVGYHFVQDRFAIFHFAEGSWVPWVIAFVGLDFLYYWYHRCGHRVNFFWAMHNVHHQSEYLNVSVALRQAWFTDLAGCLFYWPMPLLGVPIWHFLISASFLAVYQVWLHTRAVGKLERAGLVFNTPSAHRVHHGRDPQYLDCNHAATLIVWDRLFGTYREESDEPRYGITQPFRSLNPLWAQMHYYKELISIMRETSRPWDKLKLWLMPPGWLPDDVRQRREHNAAMTPAVLGEPRVRYEVNVPFGCAAYVLFHYSLAGMGVFAMITLPQYLTFPELFACALLAIHTIVNHAGMMERKPWADASELTRLALCCVATAYVWVARGLPTAGLVCAVLASGSILWYLSLRNATGEGAVHGIAR